MKKILLLCSLLFTLASLNCFAQLNIESGENVCSTDYYTIESVVVTYSGFSGFPVRLSVKQHRSGSYSLFDNRHGIEINLGKTKESALQSLKDLYSLCLMEVTERKVFFFKDKANVDFEVKLEVEYPNSGCVYISRTKEIDSIEILKNKKTDLKILISSLESYKPVKFR